MKIFIIFTPEVSSYAKSASNSLAVEVLLSSGSYSRLPVPYTRKCHATQASC